MIHTAIESCGHAKGEDFEKVLEYTNLVLHDIKYMDSKRYEELTEAVNELILENVRKVSDLEKGIIARVPVIAGCNDSMEDMEAIANFVRSLKVIKRIYLLLYHRLQEFKYTRL